MDEQRVAAIRGRMEKITAPPWYIVVMRNRMVVARSDDLGSYFVECELDEDWNVADAGFIAHAPDDMAFLLDALAAREAAAARLRAALAAADALSAAMGDNIHNDALRGAISEDEYNAVVAYRRARAALDAPPPGDGAGGGED